MVRARLPSIEYRQPVTRADLIQHGQRRLQGEDDVAVAHMYFLSTSGRSLRRRRDLLPHRIQSNPVGRSLIRTAQPGRRFQF